MTHTTLKPIGTRGFRAAMMLLLAFVMLAGCSKEQNTYVPSPPPEVTVAKPHKQTVTDYAEFTGTTDACEFVEIRARVEGYLETIHFTTSAEVKKGDLLFIIDPRPYQAELNQAEADLLIRQAELKLKEATLKRKESAYKDRAISEVEVLEARAQRDQVRASIEASRATVEKAKLTLSYTRIHAPISGQIGRNLVDVGNLVGSGGDKTLLATIVNDDRIYAYFSVTERDMLYYRKQYREHQSTIRKEDEGVVYLGLFNEKGYPHKGKMDYMENRMDAETGTIQVRGVFPNPDNFLIPGLFARIRLPVGGPKEALLVPNLALSADQRSRYLLVVNNQNTVEYRSVQIGALIDGMRVIESGISADDRVIVNGIQRARPGIKVTPKVADAKRLEIPRLSKSSK